MCEAILRWKNGLEH